MWTAARGGGVADLRVWYRRLKRRLSMNVVFSPRLLKPAQRRSTAPFSLVTVLQVEERPPGLQLAKVLR
jgi:hypothetical protein